MRYYFLDDPFKTIIDIIIIYDKYVRNNTSNNILIEPQQLKDEIKKNKSNINILLEDLKGENKNNYFIFYYLILKNYPQVSIQHDNQKFPYEFRENEEFNSKINCIKK